MSGPPLVQHWLRPLVLLHCPLCFLLSNIWFSALWLLCSLASLLFWGEYAKRKVADSQRSPQSSDGPGLWGLSPFVKISQPQGHRSCTLPWQHKYTDLRWTPGSIFLGLERKKCRKGRMQARLFRKPPLHIQMGKAITYFTICFKHAIVWSARVPFSWNCGMMEKDVRACTRLCGWHCSSDTY